MDWCNQNLWHLVKHWIILCAYLSSIFWLFSWHWWHPPINSCNGFEYFFGFRDSSFRYQPARRFWNKTARNWCLQMSVCSLSRSSKWNSIGPSLCHYYNWLFFQQNTYNQYIIVHAWREPINMWRCLKCLKASPNAPISMTPVLLVAWLTTPTR